MTTLTRIVRLCAVLQCLLTASVLAAGSIDNLPGEPGTTLPAIKAAQGSSYLLYIPKNIKRHKNYALFFYTNSGGGNQGQVNLFKEAADITGVLVAVSVESKNGRDTKENDASIADALRHLNKTIPIDQNRIWFGGSSGGARVAYRNNARHKGAGVLAIVAGTNDPKERRKGDYFMINGGHDYNRYESAKTVLQLKSQATQRYYPGGHGGCPGWLHTEGLVWLVGRKLKPGCDRMDKPGSRPGSTPGQSGMNSGGSWDKDEILAYEANVLDWIERMKAKDPHRAYYWCLFLQCGNVAGAESSQRLKALVAELGKEPGNKQYVDGIRDLDELARNTVATALPAKGSASAHSSPVLSKKAASLERSYKGTSWIEDCCKALQKPTDKF